MEYSSYLFPLAVRHFSVCVDTVLLLLPTTLTFDSVQFRCSS